MKHTAQARAKAVVMTANERDETCLSPAIFIFDLFLSVHGTKRFDLSGRRRRSRSAKMTAKSEPTPAFRDPGCNQSARISGGTSEGSGDEKRGWTGAPPWPGGARRGKRG